MMATALLPCPFCGAVPTVFTDDFGNEMGSVLHRDSCLWPSGPAHIIYRDEWASWNTRAGGCEEEAALLRSAIEKVWPVVTKHTSVGFWGPIENELRMVR